MAETPKQLSGGSKPSSRATSPARYDADVSLKTPPQTAVATRDSAYGSKGTSVKPDHVPSGRSSPHSIVSNVFSTHAAESRQKWERSGAATSSAVAPAKIGAGQVSDRSSVHSKHSSEPELAQAFGGAMTPQRGNSAFGMLTASASATDVKASPVNLYDPHTMSNSSIDRLLAKPAVSTQQVPAPMIKTALMPQRANTMLTSTAATNYEMNELTTVKRALRDRESECVTLQRLLDDERKKSISLSQEVSSIKASSVVTATKMQQVQAATSNYDATNASKLIQYEILEKRYHELLGEKHSLESRLEKLEGQVSKNAALLESATTSGQQQQPTNAEADHLRKRVFELDAKVRELEKEKAGKPKEQQEKLVPTALERLVDEMRQDNRRLRDELERLKTPSVEFVQQQLRELRRELDLLQDGNRQLIQENTTLRDQLHKLQKEQQQLSSSSASLSLQTDTASQRYFQRELLEARAQITRLQGELQQAQRQLIEHRTGAIMPSSSGTSNFLRSYGTSVIRADRKPVVANAADIDDSRSESTIILLNSNKHGYEADADPDIASEITQNGYSGQPPAAPLARTPIPDAIGSKRSTPTADRSRLLDSTPVDGSTMLGGKFGSLRANESGSSTLAGANATAPRAIGSGMDWSNDRAARDELSDSMQRADLSFSRRNQELFSKPPVSQTVAKSTAGEKSNSADFGNRGRAVQSLRSSPAIADSRLTFDRRAASAERVASWNVEPLSTSAAVAPVDTDYGHANARTTPATTAPVTIPKPAEPDADDQDSNASISPSTRSFIRSVMNRITPVRAVIPLNSAANFRKPIASPLVTDTSASRFSGKFQKLYASTTAVDRPVDESSKARRKPFAPRSPTEVRIGDSVKFLRHGGHVTRGKVLFIGNLDGRRDSYLGIELETEEEGKHDGIYEGKRYFKCRSNKGVFVAFSNVIMVV